MSKNTFTTKIQGDVATQLENIDHWFGGHDFCRVRFENGRFDTITYAMGRSVYFHLR